MFISRKKFERLEKRVADLEEKVQSQPVLENVTCIQQCRSESTTDGKLVRHYQTNV
jgi:hypothetical protein